MAGTLRSASSWRGCLLGLLIPILAGGGCSTVPGAGIPFLTPPRHILLDAVKDVRQPAPEDLPRELNKRVLAPYVVEPGDVLLVQPTNPDSPLRLPGDQPVMPDGTINLGRFGRLQVAGKTAEQIELEVQALVREQGKQQEKDKQDPDRTEVSISVRIVSRVSKVYYVLGEVNAPGAFAIAGRETVLDGILAAGGLTDRASRRNIILSRPTTPHSCRLAFPVCYREIVQLGDTTTNYQLAPGDRIYVASRTFWEDLCGTKNDCPPCCSHHTACPLNGQPDCAAKAQ